MLAAALSIPDGELIIRSDLTPNTETETKVAQEGTEAATTAEKGKAPIDKAVIEENANNLIAKGGKSMALKAWEEAVAYFGEALENMYVSYPRCLSCRNAFEPQGSLSLAFTLT